jgi:hypothetical protein
MAVKEEKKEKPSMETVQESMRLSDLLAGKVCKPVMDKIDKIEICKPDIVFCLPDRFCKPKYFCKPDIFTCLPDRFCKPKYFCKPDIFTCLPDRFCRPDIFCKPFIYAECTPSQIPDFEYEIPEFDVFTSGMREMAEVLEGVQQDIQELKKRIK